MDIPCKTAVAAALAGGYVLGRTHKAKLAFVMATYFAGRRFGLGPQELAAEGLRQLRENPKLAPLREQIRDELLTAARSAASASAERRLTSLADKLRERGNGAAEEDEEPPEEDEYEEDEYEEEGEEEGEEEEEEEGEQEEAEDDEPEEEEEAPKEEAPRRHRRPSGERRGSARGANKAAAKKPAPAKKKAAAKKAAAKKTASGTRAQHSRRGR